MALFYDAVSFPSGTRMRCYASERYTVSNSPLPSPESYTLASHYAAIGSPIAPKMQLRIGQSCVLSRISRVVPKPVQARRRCSSRSKEATSQQRIADVSK
jgi:hypothetical protein